MDPILNAQASTPVTAGLQLASQLVDDPARWHAVEHVAERDSDALARSIVQHFRATLGLELDDADAHALYGAVALAVRERLIEPWKRTRAATFHRSNRRTCYLSLEFLMGRALGNAVMALELETPLREALNSLGISLADVEALEPDAGLGNGGLGRLAACFLDSCAALGLPVTGYGLRYRYGMFRQGMEHGHQVERPDDWLSNGHPWEVERCELAVRVPFGGHVEIEVDAAADGGREHRHWVGAEHVLAVPHDVPIPGAGNGVVNTLRLWASTATAEFDLDSFNAGGYTEAVAAKTEAENITMVLYPNDASENGKVLRLRQQFFLVSASLQDALRTWIDNHGAIDGFADAHCFQLNDTHPSLAVAELMRLLIDVHELEWDAAWAITRSTMAYTNHTLLPEALECWPLTLIERLLPRPMEVVREIDRRFLAEIDARWPGDTDRQTAMAIISRDGSSVVRMAHLAIVGSFSINGVAQLHSDLLCTGLFRAFAELWPERFNNKTNGVTQRRWLAYCNPDLTSLVDEAIGEGWVNDMQKLEALEPLADDAGFQQRWRDMKSLNRARLADLVFERTGVQPLPEMMMDVQVKRIHEYKRQLLCVLHVVHAWLERRENPDAVAVPRCVVMAGKAAPGYRMAKAIIKLANNVSDVVNADPLTRDTLRFVFLPDYNVSAMQVICPGTDLSEQISTAGKEASGTGNMKFMMNGALTIGTLDGANVEILEAVGEDHFFRFGLDVDGVAETRRGYDPEALVRADERLSRLLRAFDEERFSRDLDGHQDGAGAAAIREVIAAIRHPGDPWLTLADLPAYLDAQDAVDAAWQDTARWTRSSILNTAFSGRFSTDRTMRDYNRDIWRLEPIGPDLVTDATASA